MQREDAARWAGGNPPLFAAAGTARARLEGVPYVTAPWVADPAVAGVRVIGAERAVNFHDAASGVKRKADEYAPHRGPSRRTSPFDAFRQPPAPVAVLPHVADIAAEYRADDAAGDCTDQRRRLETEQPAVRM